MKNQTSEVRDARRKLDLLSEEARRVGTEYQTWLGKIIDAVDGQDKESVNDSFDMVFTYGDRLRDIIETDMGHLLDVLMPAEEDGDTDRKDAEAEAHRLGMLLDCLRVMDEKYEIEHSTNDGSVETDSTRFVRILRDKTWEIHDRLSSTAVLTEQDYALTLEVYAMIDVLKRALGADDDRAAEKALCQAIYDDFLDTSEYIWKAAGRPEGRT